MDSRYTSEGCGFYVLLMGEKAPQLRLAIPWEYVDAANPILKGTTRPTRPLVFGAEAPGSEPTDAAFWRFTPVISDSLATIWREAGLSGYELHPASVREWPGVPYHVVSVVGRCGPQVRDRSRIMLRQPPSPRGRPTYFEVGLYFDESSWDGSDLFLMTGTSIKLCTQRCVQVTERVVGRMDCRFEPQDEYEVTARRLFPS